jgi:hypothetical protein
MAKVEYYAPGAEYPRQLTNLRQALPPDKPLLLLEFGLPTWNTIWPNGHTEAEQAAYFADILRVQHLTDTVGYVAWTLYDFETVTLPQFRFPWQTGPQKNMGVIQLDRTPKPAAQLLAPDAELSRAPVIPAWQRFTKPFWLTLFATAIGLTGLSLFVGQRRQWGRLSPLFLIRLIYTGLSRGEALLRAGLSLFDQLITRNLPWRLTGRIILRRWHNWRAWRKVSRRHHVPRRVVEYINNPPPPENIPARENHRQINTFYQQILALQRDPQHTPPQEAALWEIIGDLFAQTGHNQQAADAYHWAIKLMPQAAAVYHKLGDLLEAQGLYEEALFIYQQQAAQFDVSEDSP